MENETSWTGNLDAGEPARGRNAAAVAWGVYVAVAWTWCIGMFLPVLLVHDFGLGGWFVFTIPNVVGAGAMGWVLARPGSSEALVRAHRPACVGFSAVTLAFHVFFLFWMWRAGVIAWWASVAALGVGSVVALLGPGRSRMDLTLAAVVFGVSLMVLVRGLLSPAVPDLAGDHPPISLNLATLAPVCVFGFLLCPYLDVTFHRAVRATAASGTSRLAFGLGFGVFFLAMVVLTLLYEGDFNFRTAGARLGSFGAAGLVTWVAMHIAVQAGFTWTSHLRALPPARLGDAALWLFAAGLATTGCAIVWTVPRLHLFGIQIGTGEVVYRTFMGFYGLIFPAYVWICMIPDRPSLGTAGVAMPHRSLLIACIVAICVAGPFFWFAFITRANLWLLPGLLIVLLARPMVLRQSRRAGRIATGRGVTEPV